MTGHLESSAVKRFPMIYSHLIGIYGYILNRMIISSTKVLRAFSNLLKTKKQVSSFLIIKISKQTKNLWRQQTSTHLIINGSSVVLLMFDFSSTKCHTSEVLDECLLRPENRTAGIISREDINKTYVDDAANSDLPVDCLWVIEVTPGWGVRNDSLLFFIAVATILLFHADILQYVRCILYASSQNSHKSIIFPFTIFSGYILVCLCMRVFFFMFVI